TAAAERARCAPFFIPLPRRVAGDRRREPSAGVMRPMVVSWWGRHGPIRTDSGGAGCARRSDGAACVVRGGWPQLERGIRRSRRTGLGSLLPSSIKWSPCTGLRLHVSRTLGHAGCQFCCPRRSARVGPFVVASTLLLNRSEVAALLDPMALVQPLRSAFVA